MMNFCFSIKNYFDPEEEIDTPLVISNHVSWMDPFYFGIIPKTLMSFVGKKEVLNMPVFATIATYLQCILVERSSAISRQKTINDIKERVDNYNKNPKAHNPVIIFPEGTVSNGRSVMNFKNGAFDNLSPLTLFSLRYESTSDLKQVLNMS